MPPKKAKVKVSKSTKSGTKQGVKINIVIDQSKKTRGGNAPKPPIVRRALPAFSAMPQGPSYVGQQYRTTTQDSPLNISTIDYNILGKRVFNHLLEESQNREKSASGFSGFQTAGSQANQIFDGIYRPGRRGEPIILEPQNDISTAVDRYVTDDPETNSIIIANKLDNRGSRLPQIGENSIFELTAEERRDNALDNLVLHEKKSRAEIDVNNALDEDLYEENQEQIPTESGQMVVSGKSEDIPESPPTISELGVTQERRAVTNHWDLPPIPTASKKTSPAVMREYYKKFIAASGEAYNQNIEKNKEKMHKAMTDIADRKYKEIFLKR